MNKTNAALTGSRVPVRITAEGQERSGEVWIQSWGGRTRTELVLISFAVCWGLALLSLFIPIVNLFLAPLLIIAAPIVAYLAAREPPAIESGTGACPKCDTRLLLSRRPLRFPFTEICPNCRANLEVSPTTEKIPEVPILEREHRRVS